jgi:hypothetical protein
MNARIHWVRAGLLAIIALTGCHHEPPVPVVVLGQPDAVFPHDFEQVSNVVELRDRRIALADLKERLFLFGDFTSGDLTPVGQHKDSVPPSMPAPGIHKFPGYVLRFPGDTVGLVDFALGRTTLWTERGDYVGPVGPVGVGGFNLATNYDDHLAAYKEDVRTVMGGLEPGSALKFDSLSVLRIPRGDTTADTVAKLKLPVWGLGQFGEQKKMVSTVFGLRDLFGVLPDGSIWIARATTNSVDWLEPTGQWLHGIHRSYAPIPVLQKEKEVFIENLRRQMATAGAPAGVELSYPFADEKPPFTAGLTNPAGEVWLQRARAFDDSIPVWDVVGRDGAPIRAVQLPKGASPAGFGSDGRVYLVLRDGEGKQRIGRYVIQPRTVNSEQ